MANKINEKQSTTCKILRGLLTAQGIGVGRLFTNRHNSIGFSCYYPKGWQGSAGGGSMGELYVTQDCQVLNRTRSDRDLAALVRESIEQTSR